MKIRSTISVALVLAAIVAGIAVASSGDDSDPASTPEPAAAPASTDKAASADKPASEEAAAEPAKAAKPAKKTKLRLKGSPYGDVLFANGFAMYLFTRDKGSKSKCYGGCAEAWPPLIAKGKVVARGAVKKRLIGTTKRRDGSKQVTYKGKPLYGYVDDPRGEVLCHDVVEFGGTWLAILGSGKPAP